MFKISGLDKISRDLKDAEKALSEMDGELGTVSFDPHDPASIEAAIQKVEQLIDEKVGIYASNPIIKPLISQLKEQYRKQIIDRAAAKRISEDSASDE